MTGHTFVEKALARAAHVSEARAGDILDVEPDVTFSHDNTAPIRKIFEKIGAPGILHPERCVFTLDHAAPAPTVEHAKNHAETREWARMQGVEHQYEVGRGICHQVISEEALVLPGETILGSDSHSTHFGWLGAFGFGVGRTEMASLWATGQLWMRVPEAMRVTLNGKLAFGVTAKDICLKLIGDRGVEGGGYHSIEFYGDTLPTLSLDQRAVIPNMMAEFGAMNAYLPPDQAVFDYLDAKRTRDYTPLYPDADAEYVDEYTLDVSNLEPMLALPNSPDNVVGISEALGQPVQQAFLGTCTNGRYEDLVAAAEVLKGHKVAIRFLVIPASSEVMLKAAQTGVLATLIEAGASINSPGCGPCMGNHMGIPAPNEASITTMNRNFKGRMGVPDAPIYLASPYVVAASAITGVITDPREFM